MLGMVLIEDLGDVLARADGFIVDPFNRRWHRTTCAQVLAMTTGERKWFGATREEVERFMADRLSRYATARPIDPCPTCRPDGSPAVPPSRSAPAGDDGRRSRVDELRISPTARGFVASTAERVPFEPRPGSLAARVRAELRRRLSALRPAEGELLQAVFAGRIPANSDVENQLIYNVFDGPSTVALARGVRFELDDSEPASRFEYRYAIAPSGAPFRHWRPGGDAATWSAVLLPGGPNELLVARTWWALHAGTVEHHQDLPAGSRFGVRLTVRGPVTLTPDRLKRLVDGVVAAFQQHEAPDEAVRRIATRLGRHPSAVAAALANRERAPLGRAERPIGLTGASVHWNPDDTRLVAAEVRFRLSEKRMWQMAGTVFGVER
jgi:hypothetical protein